MNRRELLFAAGKLGIATAAASPVVSTPSLADASKPADALSDAGIPALRQAAERRWAMAGFETRLVAAGGTTLHVAVGGKGAPVLLLHGYPQSGEIWRKIAPSLAGDQRLIMPDAPGMGLSDEGRAPHTLVAAADAMDALLQTLDVGPVAVVGHDWGGAVGATLALAHPHRVKRLAFVESALAGAGFETFWRFDTPNPKLTFIPFLLMQGVAEALVVGREEVFLRHLWDTFTGDKSAAPFEDWAPYVAAMRSPGRFTGAADYYRSAYLSGDDSRRLLATGKLAVPVLPIAGELSFGAANEAMARNFATDVRPGIVLAGAGHFVPEERPAAVTEALRAFLA